MHYVIGIDGGGTSCRAAIATSDGRILAQARSGSANIRTDMVGAHESIMTAVAEALSAAGLEHGLIPDTVAVLGLAGGNVGTYAVQLKALLPFRESIIVNDGVIALQGALGPHDGVIGIVGTGSVFVSRRNGMTHLIGGWGFQVGDLGSGARLGRQLLEETLLVHDGVRTSTALTEKVMAAFDGDPRHIVEQVRDATPGFYASFAPMLVEAGEAGDVVANAILDSGCRDVERMLNAALAGIEDRICLVGGLAAMYSRRLNPHHKELLQPPLGDALQGAVAMAAARLRQATDASTARPS